MLYIFKRVEHGSDQAKGLKTFLSKPSDYSVVYTFAILYSSYFFHSTMSVLHHDFKRLIVVRTGWSIHHEQIQI